MGDWFYATEWRENVKLHTSLTDKMISKGNRGNACNNAWLFPLSLLFKHANSYYKPHCHFICAVSHDKTDIIIHQTHKEIKSPMHTYSIRIYRSLYVTLHTLLHWLHFTRFVALQFKRKGRRCDTTFLIGLLELTQLSGGQA